MVLVNIKYSLLISGIMVLCLNLEVFFSIVLQQIRVMRLRIINGNSLIIGMERQLILDSQTILMKVKRRMQIKNLRRRVKKLDMFLMTKEMVTVLTWVEEIENSINLLCQLKFNKKLLLANKHLQEMIIQVKLQNLNYQNQKHVQDLV